MRIAYAIDRIEDMPVAAASWSPTGSSTQSYKTDTGAIAERIEHWPSVSRYQELHIFLHKRLTPSDALCSIERVAAEQALNVRVHEYNAFNEDDASLYIASGRINLARDDVGLAMPSLINVLASRAKRKARTSKETVPISRPEEIAKGLANISAKSVAEAVRATLAQGNSIELIFSMAVTVCGHMVFGRVHANSLQAIIATVELWTDGGGFNNAPVRNIFRMQNAELVGSIGRDI